MSIGVIRQTGQLVREYLAGPAWPTDRLTGYLSAGLDAATPASITDANEVRGRVEAALDRGFAWSVGESITDVTALAVPVHTRDRDVIASIGIYGPSFRLDEHDAELPAQLRELVRSTAESLGL